MSAVGGLGVTRALGDYFFYPFVSAEPKISMVDFSSQAVVPSNDGSEEKRERGHEKRGEGEKKEEKGEGEKSEESMMSRKDEGEKEGKGRDNFLILASDGIWDTVGDDDGAKCVMEYPQDVLRSAVLLRDCAYLKGSRGMFYFMFFNFLLSHFSSFFR